MLSLRRCGVAERLAGVATVAAIPVCFNLERYDLIFNISSSLVRRRSRMVCSRHHS
jgi:hypothetical protein